MAIRRRGCLRHVAALALATAALFAAGTRAETVKIATWNLEHLAERDEAGCRPRVEKDYALLRRYAQALNADIVAFQEVESVAAAARVFDPLVYAIELSGRSGDTGETCRELPDRARTPLRVGFAIKRHVPYRRLGDFRELGIFGSRWGVEILMYPSTTPIFLLSIHLQSGCFAEPLDTAATNPKCAVLAEQRVILERWIDGHAERGQRFVILGDFNRRLNVAADEFWLGIDDSEPNLAADLELATAGHAGTECFPRYPELVDHIVLDRGTDLMARESTLNILRYAEPWAHRPSDHCPVSVDLVLDDGLDPGLRWVRRAAEYRALVLSTFERATARVRQIAAERRREGSAVPWVVSIDADETVVNNSPFIVDNKRTFRSFTSARWHEWVRREAAESVPGVVDFLNTVLELGGKIAVITNRDHRHHAGHTRNNLGKLGIPVDRTRVCLLGRTPLDRQERNPHEWEVYGYRNDKDRRRRLLSAGEAELCWEATESSAVRESWRRPHDIVMYLGDNIQDFPRLSQADAASQPGLASQRIGVDLFLLPNPNYGSWQ